MRLDKERRSFSIGSAEPGGCSGELHQQRQPERRKRPLVERFAALDSRQQQTRRGRAQSSNSPSPTVSNLLLHGSLVPRSGTTFLLSPYRMFAAYDKSHVGSDLDRCALCAGDELLPVARRSRCSRKRDPTLGTCGRRATANLLVERLTATRLLYPPALHRAPFTDAAELGLRLTSGQAGEIDIPAPAERSWREEPWVCWIPPTRLQPRDSRASQVVRDAEKSACLGSLAHRVRPIATQRRSLDACSTLSGGPDLGKDAGCMGLGGCWCT